MYANANVYEMRLPRGYVELSDEEMEYDGGFFGLNFIVSAACFAVSAAASYYADATGSEAARAIAIGATVVGAVASFGLATAGLNALELTAKQAGMYIVKDLTVKPVTSAVSVANNASKY
ncbi:MAG: hypothetical protein LBU30_06100 [Candidatus Methanoplasma sp.]|nr:hypothetical protein [Candidatus Methanoplasma sp.]